MLKIFNVPIIFWLFYTAGDITGLSLEDDFKIAAAIIIYVKEWTNE